MITDAGVRKCPGVSGPRQAISKPFLQGKEALSTKLHRCGLESESLENCPQTVPPGSQVATRSRSGYSCVAQGEGVQTVERARNLASSPSCDPVGTGHLLPPQIHPSTLPVRSSDISADLIEQGGTPETVQQCVDIPEIISRES